MFLSYTVNNTDYIVKTSNTISVIMGITYSPPAKKKKIHYKFFFHISIFEKLSIFVQYEQPKQAS